MLSQTCKSSRATLHLVNDAIDCVNDISRYQFLLYYVGDITVEESERQVFLEAYETKLAATLPELQRALEAIAQRLKAC